MAAFLLLFVVMLAIIYAMPQAKIVRISGTQGSLDFTQNSFDDTNYLISKESWESWSEKLYTPDDLTDESIAGQSHFLGAEEYETLQYATHRPPTLFMPLTAYGRRISASERRKTSQGKTTSALRWALCKMKIKQ